MENIFELNKDYGIICIIHENQNIIGVCEEITCNDKLFCNKCINEEDSCSKTKNHLIIPLHSFFANAANQD